MAPSGKSAEALVRRHPVLEALRDGRREIDRLWVAAGKEDRELTLILDAARELGTPTELTDKQTIDRLAQRYQVDSKHQGVLLETGPYVYSDPRTMLETAATQGEKPLLLLLDLVHGLQNVGSLLRTAEAIGVHGVIIQDRRAPDITPTVVSYAAGATEHLLIARETNLVHTMKWLKDQDVWLAGMDLHETAQPLGRVDLNRSLGIVVGHEGDGLRRLVRDTCDFLVELPMRGRVDSLNAAVAGSVLLYAAWQARGFAP